MDGKVEGNPMDCSVITNDVSHIQAGPPNTNPFAVGGRPARTHQVEYFNESNNSTKDELKLLKSKV